MSRNLHRRANLSRRHGALHKTSGFTLIEILAAITVLAIIMIALAQVLSLTGQTISLNTRALSSTRNNRAALDILSCDLDNMVISKNLTLFTKTISNNGVNTSQLSFVTRSRAPGGTSNVRFMAVSYQLSGYQLQRSLSPISWSTSDLTSAVVNPPSPTYTLLANNILGFEPVVVLDGPDPNYSNQTMVSLASATGGTTWMLSTFNGENLASSSFFALIPTGPSIIATTPRVRGLIIGIVSIDDQSARLNNALSMASTFTVPSTNQTPLQAWNASIDSGALTGFPKPAVAGLHIDQLYKSIP